MSTRPSSHGKSDQDAGVSGQRIMAKSTDSGLTLPLQNFPSSDVPLLEMADEERELYFDRLILLVKLEGEVQ